MDKARMEARQLRRNLFGANVRRVRKELGWTQKQLAEKADLSGEFISMVEKGIRGASREVQVDIAKALGTTVEELEVKEAEQESA